MSIRYLDLSGAVNFWTNIKNYILSKIPTKTSELTNDSGFLTQHQSLSNYVTLNTAQEITSAKTFKDANTVRKLTSVEAGNVIPTSDKLISDIWQDKNGKELGRIYYVKSKSGTTELIMRAGDWFTSNEGVYTLDASGTNRRAELHLYTDSSGNCCIKPVGLFSAHIKPLDSSVCLAEYGKPFGVAYVNQVRFTNATLQVDVDITATEEHSIGFFGKNNGPLSYITFQKRPNLKDRIAVRIQTAPDSYKSYDFDATCFYPESNNSVDIGSTTNIFKNIYCNNYYKGTMAFGDIVTHNASEFLTSHQSLANYALDANVVHTSGNETVSGQKTFTNDIIVSKNASNMAIHLQNLSYDPKTNGQSGIERKSCSINFLTSTGDPYININAYGLSDRTLLRLTNSYFTDSQNIDSDSVEFSIYGNGARSFRPKNTSNCDLGESNKQWKGVYATNYYYGSNNVEFSTKFVTTDTNQTITGTKTLDNVDLPFKNSAELGVSGGSTNITFSDKNGQLLCALKANVYSSGVPSFHLTVTQKVDNTIYTTNGIALYQAANTKIIQLRPALANDNADGLSVWLGSPLNTFSRIYGLSYYYGNDNVEFSTKFVTTDTAQTISGNKTFGNGTLIVDNGTGNNVHGEIKLNGTRPVYINADNSEDGLFANTSCGMSILLNDSSKSIHIGGITTGNNGRKLIKTTEKAPYLTLGTQEVGTQILVPENDTADSTFSITSTLKYASGASAKSFTVKFKQGDDGSSSVFPVANNKADLGLSGNRWKNVYATNYYYGSDAVEFSTKFVTSDTTQTITGAKTFASSPLIYNSDTTGSVPQLTFKNSKTAKGSTTETGAQLIYFADKNNAPLSMIESRVVSNGCTTLSTVAYNFNDSQNVSSSVKLIKNPTTAYYAPGEDNDISLGRASARWLGVYATNYYYGADNVEFSTKFVTTDTAQTVSGQKLFNDINAISNSAEIGVSAGNNSYRIRDKNKKTMSLLEGGTFSSGMAYGSWLVNNGSDAFNGVYLYSPSANLAQLRPYSSTLSLQLGSSSGYFSDCYTSKINGLTPSSLSLPSDRSVRVDISSYFTDTSNGGVNRYTAPSNGFVYLAVTDVVTIHLFSQDSGRITNYGDTRGRATAGQLYAFLPVRNGDVFTSQWYTTLTNVSLTSAYFIPCQGNV